MDDPAWPLIVYFCAWLFVIDMGVLCAVAFVVMTFW